MLGEEQAQQEGTDSQQSSSSTWVSAEHWRDRIRTFNASWFVVSMGTGAITQILYNFPYPSPRLNILGYCFWILCIILFALSTVLGITQWTVVSNSFKEIFLDFSRVSYLGSFIISLDNIITGIVIFYNDRPAAIWAAYGLFWFAMTLTVVVGCAAVVVSCCYQKPHDISEVSGVWLLSFIPFIVTSATGATLITYVGTIQQQIILTISFLSWSLGETLSCILMCLYFWRLLASSLPARELIISCFIPMGPTGEGAYSIQNLAVGLGTYIQTSGYLLSRGPHKQATIDMIAAVAESINWLGVIVALFLVSFSTFWLIQATCSVILRIPKQINVGFWSFVFPFAVYTNALCRLAQDLDNTGFRVWAAICTVVTVLLWLACALMTLWKGVWKGRLFFAPGLEGWNERRASNEKAKDEGNGLQQKENIEASVEGTSLLDTHGDPPRMSHPDGTYSLVRRKRQDGEMV